MKFKKTDGGIVEIRADMIVAIEDVDQSNLVNPGPPAKRVETVSGSVYEVIGDIHHEYCDVNDVQTKGKPCNCDTSTERSIWYWYIERSTEILLDIDKPTKLALSLSRQKASGFVRKSTIYASSGGSGFHVAVELFDECVIDGMRIDALDKNWDRFKDVLRSRFLDDPYRSQIGAMREIWSSLSLSKYGIRPDPEFGLMSETLPSPLLISREKWTSRECDEWCYCPSKANHISGECEVARGLRGSHWSSGLLGDMPAKIDPDSIGLGVYFEIDAIP